MSEFSASRTPTEGSHAPPCLRSELAIYYKNKERCFQPTPDRWLSPSLPCQSGGRGAQTSRGEGRAHLGQT